MANIREMLSSFLSPGLTKEMPPPLLPEDLTIAGGELTPTLKVRRAVVEKVYRDVIETLYG